jgi:PAS domain S-box-containing protein
MIFNDTVLKGSKKDLDKIHIAIMMDNLDGQVEFVNKSFCDLFGYSKTEIKKLDNYALVHPDERDIVFKRHIDRVSKNQGTPEEYELRGVTKDGKEIYLWAFSLIRLDGNKNPIGTINYLWDMSSYKKLAYSLTECENELIQSETELQGILESTADGILAVDKDGKVKMTNKRFAKLWNIPDDILASGNDDILLSHVLDQLVDPEEFR